MYQHIIYHDMIHMYEYIDRQTDRQPSFRRRYAPPPLNYYFMVYMHRGAFHLTAPLPT